MTMRRGKRVRLYDADGKETFSDGNEIWRRLGAKEEKPRSNPAADRGNVEENSDATAQEEAFMEEVIYEQPDLSEIRELLLQHF